MNGYNGAQPGLLIVAEQHFFVVIEGGPVFQHLLSRQRSKKESFTASNQISSHAVKIGEFELDLRSRPQNASKTSDSANMLSVDNDLIDLMSARRNRPLVLIKSDQARTPADFREPRSLIPAVLCVKLSKCTEVPVVN